VVELVDTHA